MAASWWSSSAVTARCCGAPSAPAGTGVPLLGVNLGHVGFLAELEREELDEVVAGGRGPRLPRRGADDRGRPRLRGRRRGRCTPGRSTRSPSRRRPRTGCSTSWSRSTAGRCRGGCATGSLVATPTGLHRLLLLRRAARSSGRRSRRCCSSRSARTPCSPGRWSRAPTSMIALDSVAPEKQGVLWADGRRSFTLPHNARIEVRRDPEPVRFARLRDAPFTDRLVAKFAPARRPAGAAPGGPSDPRAADPRSGRDRRGHLPRSRPGSRRSPGETGAGKTMVVTGLGLLAGGRADAALVRAGSAQAAVEGVFDVTGCRAWQTSCRRPAESWTSTAAGRRPHPRRSWAQRPRRTHGPDVRARRGRWRSCW